MSDNPLLKKIQLPGKRFRLPSRGLFYINGELDDSVEGGEIEVFSMTTSDEVTLRSPEFLFTGESIERVFLRCVPEIKKPLELLSKDVDYVLACLRIVSYGGIYNITTRCPRCEELQKLSNGVKYDEFMKEVEGKAKEQNVPMDLAITDDKVVTRIKAINGRKSNEQTYPIDLNGIVLNATTEIDADDYVNYTTELSNGQHVQLCPITMDSSVAAYQFQNADNNLDLTMMEDFLSFIISCSVQSIDGVTDRDQIQEWAKNLPVKLKDEIETAMSKVKTWGTDFTYSVTCKTEGCGHSRNISTLLNPITFFMTPSKSEEPVS